MNMNYLTLPLLVFNISFTCAIARKVFYPKSADITLNEEIHGECGTIEVIQTVETIETESKNLDWYSNDCETQRMNAIRADNHFKRGLIRLPEAKNIIDHYRKLCK